MFVIEQPIPPAPAIGSTYQAFVDWNVIYDVYNEELKSLFEKQARVERFDLIQTFHACIQEEVKPVGPYVIKMKGCVEQLEHLGYVLPQDLSVGLILNGLTSDFAEFVRNYNMHNIGKTIGEPHALLIEYKKGLPKKAVTPQDYALEFATCILNMVLTKKVDKTPYELRSVKCIFIGYPKETMGYHFYFPPKNKIVVARRAEFLKKNLISQEVSGRVVELEEIQDKDTSPSENTSEIEVEGFCYVN
nr:zinc finger, CCHC-type [Tanacetum cinerariifolium]